jgi:hypothetical protein
MGQYNYNAHRVRGAIILYGQVYTAESAAVDASAARQRAYTHTHTHTHTHTPHTRTSVIVGSQLLVRLHSGR